MIKQERRIRRWFTFGLGQLAGAGFAVMWFALFIMQASGFDLFEWSDTLTGNFPLGWIFYGYGLACSLVITGLGRLFPRLTLPAKVLLYAAAGYAYFLLRDTGIFGLIAGTIGALFALVFFAGTRWAAASLPFRWIFGAVVPLVLLVLLNIDYTVKRGWTAEAAPGSYEARFDYFNGKHEIPIEAQRGQRVVFEVQLDNANGGGHGLHVLDASGKYTAMEQAGGERLAIRPQRDGTYRIVLTGDGLQGKFKVEWAAEPNG